VEENIREVEKGIQDANHLGKVERDGQVVGHAGVAAEGEEEGVAAEGEGEVAEGEDDECVFNCMLISSASDKPTRKLSSHERTIAVFGIKLFLCYSICITVDFCMAQD